MPSIEAKDSHGLQSSAFGRDGIIRAQVKDEDTAHSSLEEACTAASQHMGFLRCRRVSSPDVLELRRDRPSK